MDLNDFLTIVITFCSVVQLLVSLHIVNVGRALVAAKHDTESA
jgi:hypothetical protein